MNISSASEKMELASKDDDVAPLSTGNNRIKKKKSSSSSSWTDRLDNNAKNASDPAAVAPPCNARKMIICNGREIDLQELRESLAAAEKIAQDNLEVKSQQKKKSLSSSANKPQIFPAANRKYSTQGSNAVHNASNNNNSNSIIPNTSKKPKSPQKKKSSKGSLLKLTKSSGANGGPFVPPKQLLLYLVRMGSFTSMPKIAPAPNSDDRDLAYPEEPEDLETTLARCSEHLAGLPEPIERSWSQPLQSKSNEDQNADFQGGEKIRVLQWNALSQALGTKNDNFVKCPPEALEWKTRRFRMLEEIVRHDADVICLQEVDHFRFFLKSLAPLGYHGHFFPKPDSPCLYLPENTGPDGCAIFYKTKKFDLTKVHNRVIEVWHVESNQVVMCTTLRSRTTGQEVCVATTHLKARNGALLSTLRNEQGKDLIEFMASESRSCGPAGSLPRAVICCGDFNAEPTEPVYQTMTENDLKLQSAYATIDGNEPKYTTWKIREDGEHIQTLDYMFYSEDQLEVNGLLDFPDGEAIGQNRLPSTAFASDHFSLVVDFTMKAHPKKRFCKE